ncbi:mucin-7-like [Brachypodium distachyon]|uniref:mucin-7-like n=1 Tax=Brachypodium distachyon TaxID=15368 RepID=UPI00052FFC74|nr:mucin-7-like [Brachypodium distachyon]|eukprot:XP_010230268.1 mucin-7-like [Brachypodium distachyon]
MLSSSASPLLGEEDDFETALAPPPRPLYCPAHGFGPCPARDGTAPPLPSPTPPAPAVDSTPPTVDNEIPAADSAPPTADAEPLVTDPAPPADDGAALDDVHPEARRLLRKFAAAMAAHRSSPAASGWNPASLGLSSCNDGGPSFP